MDRYAPMPAEQQADADFIRSQVTADAASQRAGARGHPCCRVLTLSRPPPPSSSSPPPSPPSPPSPQYLADLRRVRSGEIFICRPCQSAVPISERFAVAACGHRLCRACARDYILAQVERDAFPILCPLCPPPRVSAGRVLETGVIDLIEAEAVLSPAQSLQMHRRATAMYLSHPSVVRCLRPGCAGFREIPGHDGGSRPGHFVCPVPSCRFEFDV